MENYVKNLLLPHRGYQWFNEVKQLIEISMHEPYWDHYIPFVCFLQALNCTHSSFIGLSFSAILWTYFLSLARIRNHWFQQVNDSNLKLYLRWYSILGLFWQTSSLDQHIDKDKYVYLVVYRIYNTIANCIMKNFCGRPKASKTTSMSLFCIKNSLLHSLSIIFLRESSSNFQYG